MERLETDAFELLRKFGNLGLVLDRGKRIRLRCRRTMWVLAARSMHVKQRFGLVIIRCERVIFEGPRGRDAAGMDNFLEITLAQPEECGAINLTVAADPIMKRRTEASAAGVDPPLFGLISAVYEDSLRAPVGLLPRKIIAALKDENALACCCESLGKRGPPGPGPGPVPITIRS
jgi:hypothetical protein